VWRKNAGMKNPGFLRRNGLSLTLGVLFLVFMAGQAYFGWQEHNEEQTSHGEPIIDFVGYLGTGHFLEATAENWESEFLQMAAYVLLTVGLFQKGSSESKALDEPEEVDRDPRASANKAEAPWPVRRGGWVLRMYEHSLSIAFTLLFVGSLALHAIGGAAKMNAEHLAHGEPPVSIGSYISGSSFWFESFQNWQSEFLALFAMVVLSIFLRERGSPESKPVDASHDETGSG
jgi:hypothetical protein